MAFPDVLLEFSPTTDPLDIPVWEDITRYLRAFSYTRGRATDLDHAEAGIATFVMDNWDGQFDPTNTNSPYYPNIRPMLQIRLTSLPVTSVLPFYVGDSYVGDTDMLGDAPISIALFSGFVENWDQTWSPTPLPKPDSVMTIRAVDAFKALTLWRQLGYNVGPHYTGVVLGQLLDVFEWPADLRRIDQGQYTMTALISADSFLLAPMQEIDQAEGGLLFMGGDGAIVFRDSGYSASHPPAPEDVWGDLAAERQYQSIDLTLEDRTIYNVVMVVNNDTAIGARVEDTTSKARYLPRDYTLDVPLTDPGVVDFNTRGYDFLARHAHPKETIVSMEVGVRDDVAWESILSKEMLDRIVVRRRPYQGGVLDQDSTIEGISVDSSHFNDWKVTWRLSATPAVNELSATQSTFDFGGVGLTTGWTATGGNSTISAATGTVAALHGYYTMRMQSVASGDMFAETTPTTQTTMDVVVGHTYTALASFQAATAPRTCRVEISWRNAAGAALSSSVGTGVADVVGSYVPVFVTAVAPSSAAFAVVRVKVLATGGASETHHVDNVGFFVGTQTSWTLGRGTL